MSFVELDASIDLSLSVTADVTKVVPVTSTVNLTPSMTATLDSRTDLTAAIQLTLSALSSLEVVHPPPTPPASVPTKKVRRLSITWPTPTRDAFDRPVNWTPTSTVDEEWGYLQLIVGDYDATYYRGIPAEIVSWSSTEPFDDATAVLRFKQISIFAPQGGLELGGSAALFDQMHRFPNIDILLVRPDNSQKVLWEGMAASWEISDDYVEVQCIGALYQLDWYRKAPVFDTARLVQHMATIIAGEFTTRPAMRTGPPLIESGVYNEFLLAKERGAWQPVLSGYVQDLIANGQIADGRKLTVRKKVNRQPWIVFQDRTTVNWTVTLGAPGVQCRMHLEHAGPNNAFGEGIGTDQCHWRNSKYPANYPTDLPYIHPLAQNLSTEPWLYAADGTITGANPDFDRTNPRRERYTNYGQGFTKDQAFTSALRELDREQHPGWTGTITLTADPEEGSRFEIKAGDNIKVRALGGQSPPIPDAILHIVRCEVDPLNLKVTLTVDEDAHDFMTLAQIMARDRQAIDAVRRARTFQKSRLVTDQIAVFDCESNAGIVPATVLGARRWSVIRIPAGQYGSFVRVELTTSAAASKFSAAVFDSTISADDLHRLINAPLDNDANGRNPWETFPTDRGLLISWGGPGQACGYQSAALPGGNEGAGDPVTGQFIDNASWEYLSLEPPYLWLAVYADVACTVSGRLYPGPEGFS